MGKIMQAIIVDNNGNKIAEYSSWDEESLNKEITKTMNENKKKNPKAYKCILTHMIFNYKVFASNA